ncbi:MAG: NosD domain-containing protein [Myxococcota bacterium]
MRGRFLLPLLWLPGSVAFANEGVTLVDFSSTGPTSGTGWSCTPTAGCTISASGSYALSTGFFLASSSPAFRIQVPGGRVSLNLNGHFIENTDTGAALFASDLSRLSVRNGFLSGGEVTLDVDGRSDCEVQLESLDIQSSSFVAIYLLAGSISELCSGTSCEAVLRMRKVFTSPTEGAALRVEGFGAASIQDSHLAGAGVYAFDTAAVQATAAQISSSWFAGNSGTGGLRIWADSANIQRNDVAGGGIHLSDLDSAFVRWNDVRGGAAGIDAYNTRGVFVENLVSDAITGFALTDPGSLLLRNIAHNNTTGIAIGSPPGSEFRVRMVGNRFEQNTTPCTSCLSPFYGPTNRP